MRKGHHITAVNPGYYLYRGWELIHSGAKWQLRRSVQDNWTVGCKTLTKTMSTIDDHEDHREEES